MKRKLYAVITTQFRPKPTIFRYLIAAICFLTANNSFAQTGQALSFDGVDDRIDLPFVISGSYTKEAWVYPTALGGYYNILSGDATALYINGSNLAAGHAQPYTEVLDPSPMSVNTWYHIAVSFDAATNTIRLYKNGILVATNTTVGYTETVDYIGAFYFFGPSTFFAGQIDEVRWWNRVRTGTEISGSMSCELTGDEPGLIAYYKLNQGTAGGTNTGVTTAVDSTDKCFPSNGTLVNFTLTGSSSNWVSWAPTAPMISGTCANFFSNINVTGNGNCILNGDMTPSASDYTDFGMYTGVTQTRNFIIQNTGNTTLNISSATVIGSANFTITQAPASTVAPGSSTIVQVSYYPLTTGTSNATVTINNDDGDEGTFSSAVTGSSTILPVELSNFKAEKGKDKVNLLWQTSSEHNNSGFELQRSADAATGWQKVAFITGAGNSSLAKNYNYTDAIPMNGINAYRLKQIDFDGKFKYSQVVVVNFTGKGAPISLYPNPVKDKVNLQFSDNNLLNSTARLSSVTGRLIASIKLTNNRQDIDLSNLSKGTYLLAFSNGEVRRIIKQ